MERLFWLRLWCTGRHLAICLEPPLMAKSSSAWLGVIQLDLRISGRALFLPLLFLFHFQNISHITNQINIEWSLPHPLSQHYNIHVLENSSNSQSSTNPSSAPTPSSTASRSHTILLRPCQSSFKYPIRIPISQLYSKWYSIRK